MFERFMDHFTCMTVYKIRLFPKVLDQKCKMNKFVKDYDTLIWSPSLSKILKKNKKKISF